MIGYDPSYLNETETLLEEFHKIQKYLFENPIYKIYQANVDYVTSVNEYYITDVITQSGDTLGVGDVVLFRNVYYGVITEINEDTQMFTIAEGISFRGARGLQGETGPAGPVGPAGPNPLFYTHGVYLFDASVTELNLPRYLEIPVDRFNRTPVQYEPIYMVCKLNSGKAFIVSSYIYGVENGTAYIDFSSVNRSEVTGPVGPTGPTGPTGEMGLSIYLYDGEIVDTTTTVTLTQIELPTGRDIQVGDILFSTYETTYGAMAQITLIDLPTVTVDYIGQVASAGGGGVSDVQVNGTSIVADGVANIPLASTTSAGVVSRFNQKFAGAKTFGGGSLTLADANNFDVMRFDVSTSAYLQFIPSGSGYHKYRFYDSSNKNYPIVFTPNNGLIHYDVSTNYAKNNPMRLRNGSATSTLPDYTGTLLSAPSTWSTGTSGTVTLPDAGLYEFKVAMGLFQATTFVNWDGTNPAMSPILTDGSSDMYMLGVVNGTVMVSKVGTEDVVNVNVSYRKIGIA